MTIRRRWRRTSDGCKLHSAAPAVQFNGGLASAARRKTSHSLCSRPGALRAAESLAILLPWSNAHNPSNR